MAIAALVAGGWWWYEREHLPPPLSSESVWSRLQAYPLTDVDSTPPDLSALSGKVVLLNFIYTRCPSVCPRLQNRMRHVLQSFQPTPHLAAVSISLDPEHDTPQHLRVYAKSYGVPGHLWFFWRPLSQSWAIQLARSVFGLMAAPISETEILHADALLLIDCEGRVRGLYSSEDDRILKHTEKLLELCGTDSSS
ncbi:MAG: SCO family protein [Bacteroidia bacterium]|nr:SCO family protein [Bacteroidia bacterium]